MVNDVAKMIAQAPALFEGLTGMKLSDLMRAVPAIGEAIDKAQNGHNGHNGDQKRLGPSGTDGNGDTPRQ